MSRLKSMLLAIVLSSVAAAGADGDAPLAVIENPDEYKVLTPAISAAQIKNYAERAERQDPIALDIMMFCNMYGLGMTADIPKSLDYLERGVRVGSPLATLFKGRNLKGHWSDSSLKDPDRAEELLQRAEPFFKTLAEKGNAQSMAFVGVARENLDDKQGAFQWYERSANAGFCFAQTGIAGFYADGIGTKADPAQTCVWNKKAADQNFSVGFFGVGQCYYFGLGVPKDLPKAMESFKKAAERGTPYAQFSLGRALLNGEGLAQDDAAGVEWLERARANRVLAAMELLSTRYRGGVAGMPPNAKRAFEVALEAARLGSEECQGWVGPNLYNRPGLKSADDILNFVMTESKKNEALEMQYALALYYLDGFGVDKDTTQGLNLMTRAANAGYDWAQWKLSWFNRTGQYLGAVNPELSHTWMQKAADQDFHEAYHQLAWQFDNGFGCKQDFKASFKNKLAAGKFGCVRSKHEIGFAYVRGMGCDRDIEKGMALLKEAAEAGNVDGMAEYGVSYADAMPQTPENRQLAREWLMNARKAPLAQQYLLKLDLEDDAGKNPAGAAAIEDLSKPYNGGETVLMRAISLRLSAEAAKLVDMGADALQTDEKGRTPLAYAAWFGDNASADLLIAKGAQWNVFTAAGLGNVAELTALLQDDWTLATREYAGGWAPIIAAARNDRIDTAKLLLDFLANVNSRDADGCTPLIWAVRRGNKAMAELFLLKGAKVGDADAAGRTALNYAQAAKNQELVKLLQAHAQPGVPGAPPVKP